jgi:hypothetical protein
MHTHTHYTQALLNTLQVENTYRTDDLARILQVEKSSMLRKGVITRKGQNLLIVLIFLEKRTDATPYSLSLHRTANF